MVRVAVWATIPSLFGFEGTENLVHLKIKLVISLVLYVLPTKLGISLVFGTPLLRRCKDGLKIVPRCILQHMVMVFGINSLPIY